VVKGGPSTKQVSAGQAHAAIDSIPAGVSRQSFVVLNTTQTAQLLRFAPPAVTVPAGYALCPPNTPAALRATKCQPEKPDTAQWPATPASSRSYLDAQAAASEASLGRAAPPSQPVIEAETTYAEASRLLGGGGPNPYVLPSTPVWIVTVPLPWPEVSVLQRGGGGPSATPKESPYTIILDASNGAAIDSCSGCATLRLR
jgi:hypothetical protein